VFAALGSLKQFSYPTIVKLAKRYEPAKCVINPSGVNTLLAAALFYQSSSKYSQSAFFSLN